MSFVCNVIVVVICFTTVLQGMQPAQSEADALVLELAIRNRHLYFDHKDICSCALVNKNYESILRNTATERRAHLIELVTLKDPLLLGNFSPLTWHKHGSMCAGKKVYSYVHGKHHNAELCSFVFKNNGVVHDLSHLFPYNPDHGEYQSLFNHVKIMEQEVCCYGFDQYKSNLFEYSFSRDVKYCSRSCMVKIDNEHRNTYPLAWLVKFPLLFKAIFNAPIKVKNETEVIYDLNSAIIPDNFKKACASKYSFEVHMLPALQNAITKRYAEQPKK